MPTNGQPTFADLYLQQVLNDFQGIKKLGDKAMAQLDDAGINYKPDPEANSIAVIVKHMHGNMLSRWTDFLTTDGEKPTRQRDEEFEGELPGLAELLRLWEEGWALVLSTLEELTEADVLRTVTIRGEPHSVMQAIQRQVSHYGYHVGQIVYAAKLIRSSEWNTLSIPKRKPSAQ
ncbi:DinB family protein [Paenibacillus sp. MBLB4367]|uniref:DinB family protein n=1 Tax=Paenibacillus sp. MBLB4367 TaxID=3384767 RepID=UPI0039082EB8